MTATSFDLSAIRTDATAYAADFRILIGVNLASLATIAYVDNAIANISLTPGPQGPAGPQGAIGPPGPNTVSGSTATALLGLLYGNGTNVAVASSANVVTALGYTPANKSGDTFTGATTFGSNAARSTVIAADGTVTVRSDDNGMRNAIVLVNSGVTGINQGVSLIWRQGRTAVDTGEVAAIRALSENDYTTGGRLTRLAFVTQGSNYAERMSIASNGNVTFLHLIRLGIYTVATLPSASANASTVATVTDSSVTSNGSPVAGGGSNRVLVFSNGSTWDVVAA